MQQQKINIDISKADDIACEECENLYFTPVVMVKRLSALLSPTGQEVKIPVQVLQCTSCSAITTPFSE
tara:strand:+ start:778 stop:981 length:204 start_codon:yes stop_codon:yes gene_type:complete